MQEAPEKITRMNEEIRERLKIRDSNEDKTKGQKQTEFIKIINEAAQNNVEEKSQNEKRDYISEETYQRILNKEEIKKKGEWEKLEIEKK